MAVSDEKLALICWEDTAQQYGYTSQAELTNKSKVIVRCNDCQLPKLHTSIISMRANSGQKRKGQTKYIPVCPSCQQKHTWASNPEFRQKQSAAQSAAMKQVWNQPGYRENQSEKHQITTVQMWQDPSYRERVIRAITEKHATDPSYTARSTTAWRTEESIRKQLEATHTEAHRNKVKAILSRPDVQEKMSAAALRSWSCPDYRRRVTESNIAAWENDQHRRERHAMALANQPRVSSIQKLLYKLLGDLEIPFHEEGQETVVGHYVFDCLIPKEEGGGILIECQGDYWHTLPNVAARDRSKFTYIDRYFPEYEVMYLWEHEFYTNGRVLDRLRLKLGIQIPTVQFQFQEIEIREVEQADQVREFLDAYHYIGKGRGGKSWGAYHNQELVGVAVYSPQLRQNTATQFGARNEELRELSRFCIHPSYHKKNFASWFLAQSLRRVGSPLVVAYADTTAGHSGTIYTAAGFQLHHIVEPDYWYVDQEGFVMHKRTLYGRAKRLGLTERQYAEQFNYHKKWGGAKNCFLLDTRSQP